MVRINSVIASTYSMNSVTRTILLCLAVVTLLHSSLPAAKASTIQSGRRFPLGVQVGDAGNVSCESSDDVGLLSFGENQVWVCRDAGNGVYGFAVVGSNETVSVNEELLELRNRVNDLEESNEVGLGPRLDESNRLQAITMCNLHGVYDSIERECVCDCSAKLGCWNSSSYCTTCHEGWTGEHCRGDVESPVITLLGNESMHLEIGESYVEPGFTAHDNKDLDVTAWVVTSHVTGYTPTVVGFQFTVVYSVSDNAGNSDTASRTVEVVDTTPPVLSLRGDAVVTIEAGAGFSDPGVDISDNSGNSSLSTDSDLASQNLRLTGSHTVAYTGSDGSGNEAIPISRTIVVVDTTPPVITLTGASVVSHIVGDVYVDAGATVTDNADNGYSLTSESDVNATVIGNYTVTYEAVDDAGNVATPVSREVRVTDYVLSCDGITGTTTDGVYNVRGVDTYCHFSTDGHGYDLLFNLDTDDNIVHSYGDSAFWETNATVGDVNVPYSGDYKGESYGQMTNLVELLLMYHTEGVFLAEAIYPILPQFHNDSFAFLDAMQSLTHQVFTYARSNNKTDFTIAPDDSIYSASVQMDVFATAGDPILLNRQSGYGSDVTNVRISTTLEPSVYAPVWTFVGIGGLHQHTTHGIKYEAQLSNEFYCPFDNVYGSFSGNYEAVGSLFFPSECIPGSAIVHDVDVAVFARSIPVPSTPLMAFDSCDGYIQRNPSAQTGPTLLGDGRRDYCVFDGGKGYTLLVNLDTSDRYSRDFDSSFWTQTSTIGTAENALEAEFMSPMYYDAPRMAEIIILYHTQGQLSSSIATYDVLPAYQNTSLQSLMANEQDLVFTSSKTSGFIDQPVVPENNPSSATQIDMFMEDSSPLMVNRMSGYGSDVTNVRISTTYAPITPHSTVWFWFGIGGHHEHTSHGMYYEFHPATEWYCGFDNAYTTSSDTKEGNYRQVGSKYFPFSCASGNFQYHPIDGAILARIPVN